MARIYTVSYRNDIAAIGLALGRLLEDTLHLI